MGAGDRPRGALRLNITHAPKQQWRPSRHPILSATIDLGSHGGRRAIARCPCTRQGPMKVRGEKLTFRLVPVRK